MAGFFPVMMFGIPAAALAMYHTAESKQMLKLRHQTLNHIHVFSVLILQYDT
jgi:phosphotransferase system  glucose/maltose/N-acetylglucosamine-specific IIC component